MSNQVPGFRVSPPALVMTGNSRFKQEQIDAFARRVEARGGRLTRHIFLRRGRIYWQLSRPREAARGDPCGAEGALRVKGTVPGGSR
ncbi:MAG: hypothetical protein ACOZQL_02000 [Myxococcota bacterium]